jgi:hypothetical protein
VDVGWAVVRAVARRRARALVLLLLLLALAAGTTLGGLAAAARGRSAPTRLQRAAHPADVTLFTPPGPDGQARVDALRRVLQRSDVDHAHVLAAATLVTVVGADTPSRFLLADVSIDDAPPVTPVVIHGVAPETADEVALNEASARSFRVGVGDRITLAWYHAADLEALGGGHLAPPAGTRAFLVTGITRMPRDLVDDPRAEPGTIFAGNAQTAAFPEAFWRDAGPDLASYAIGAAVDTTPAERDALVAAAAAEGGNVVAQVGQGTDDNVLQGVQDGVDLEAAALTAFAGILGLGAVIFLGAATARAATASAEDRRVLVSLGVTRRDQVTAAALLGAMLGTAAALGALVVAGALSARAPIGFARRAELNLGVDLDWSILGPGAAVVIALVVGASVLGAVRPPRTSLGGSPARTGVAVGYGPLSAAVGLRLLTSRRAAAGAALRSAAAMAVVGTVAVVAAWCFAGTLRHLVDTPSLQGWSWDLAVGNYSEPESVAKGAAALAADPDVVAYGGINGDVVTIDGIEVTAAGMEPGIQPEVIRGRAAKADDEVAVGAATLERLGVAVGDRVTVGPRGSTHPFTVVGLIVPPAPLIDGMSLDDGAVFTFTGFRTAFGGDAEFLVPFAHLVDLRAGADPDAVRARLAPSFPGVINTRALTADIRSLRRVQGLPYALAGLLGAMGAGAVVLVLASLARGRRVELALLRSIGFSGRQLGAVVLWQAVLFAGTALAIGLPLGIAAGRQLWYAVADGLGTALSPLVPASSLALVAAAAIAITALLSLVPAWSVRKLRAAVVLRASGR